MSPMTGDTLPGLIRGVVDADLAARRYGYPCVANPHDFDPDHECCSPAEIETHRLAKANWGKPAFVPNRGCGALVQDGRVVGRVTRTSWGIGVNLINHCDECNTPDDDLMYCHDCARDLCPVCWPKHEQAHEERGS